MKNIYRLIKGFSFFTLLLFLVCMCKSGFASIDAVSSEDVKIEGNSISVQAKGITKGKLLKTIEKKMGIKFRIREFLRERKVSVRFKKLSILEGIKKIIYPLNYAIVYDPDDKISKVVILDINKDSSPTTYDNRVNEFSPPGLDGSAFMDTQMGGGGIQTIPGSEFDMMEPPPFDMVDNTYVETKTTSRTIQGKDLREADTLEYNPPENNLTEATPGTDSPISGSIHKDDFDENKANILSGIRPATKPTENECGTGFDFNDGTNQGWRILGLYDNDGSDPVPGFFNDIPASFSESHNSPDLSPDHDSLSNGKGSIYVDTYGDSYPDSPSNSTFLHWDLNSPDLSSDARWQGISYFTYDVVSDIDSEDGSTNIQAVLHIRYRDLTEEYVDTFFGKIPHDSNWSTHTIDLEGLGMPQGTTILNINLRIFFEASKNYNGVIRVDNVTPIGGNGCSE